MKKIAVLMTCHNRKTKTLCCIKLLYSQILNDVLLETFLVDDGCTDGSVEAISKLFPQVIIIKGDGSLFWNRGMCLAWDEARKRSGHDAVLWLNDDTMLYPDAVQQLVDMSTSYPNANIVATIKGTNSEKITYGGYLKDRIVVPDGTLKTCDKFNGNCVLIPVSVSNIIGYLDPYYRHSKGDSDYAIRSNLAGIKNIVGPIVGTCDRNPPEPIWNKGNIIQRFKKLYSPLGKNPFEIYHIKRKTSFWGAVYGFVYIHIRVLATFFIPQKVFNKLRKNRYE